MCVREQGVCMYACMSERVCVHHERTSVCFQDIDGPITSAKKQMKLIVRKKYFTLTSKS